MSDDWLKSHCATHWALPCTSMQRVVLKPPLPTAASSGHAVPSHSWVQNPLGKPSVWQAALFV